MALKLSDALGPSPELWVGMQAQYDLWRASQHRRKRVTPLFVGAGISSSDEASLVTGAVLPVDGGYLAV
jgi:plasmid maintenance system antidote protein VapI